MITAIFVIVVFTLVLALRAAGKEKRKQRTMVNGTWQYLRDNFGTAFDALCSTTAVILRTDICQINIVGEPDQFHLGKYPTSGARVDAAKDSACRFVVKRGETIDLSDCTSDADFKELPPVRAGLLTSYLGVPLYHKGRVVGAFCVGSHTKREWTKDEIDILHNFAKCLGLQLSLEDSLI